MASMTLGYSDSEDRVWVRLVDEHDEQRVWLTRRSVFALIKALAKQLETSLGELDSILQMGAGERLAMEQDEAAGSMNANAPEPAPRSKNYQVADKGLCSVFDLESRGMRWVVRLHTVRGQPLEFDGNRLQMHQLLKSLLNRQLEADWRLPAPLWLTGKEKV